MHAATAQRPQSHAAESAGRPPTPDDSARRVTVRRAIHQAEQARIARLIAERHGEEI